MQLGVDFDGTVTRYYACYKRDGGDGRCCEVCETFEGAKQSINGLKRRKSIKCHIDRFSFWIMKQTLKAERVWPEGNEVDYEKAKK